MRCVTGERVRENDERKRRKIQCETASGSVEEAVLFN